MNTRSLSILVAGVAIALVGVALGATAFLAAPILLVAALIAFAVWWVERRATGKEPEETPRDHP